MITKFDSSYYGTVDMENLGYAGTPINERRYSQAELGGALHKVVEYAKCMDERGYNTFWMAEHHFQPEGTELIPNLLMMAMHLCGVGGTTAVATSSLHSPRGAARARQLRPLQNVAGLSSGQRNVATIRRVREQLLDF
jgi:alkanesulfonate monooxygenase SsuD/methylene tetrahydromethanopterin reductase-like flavin-dependent oxidoreductase (luciferase family)